MSETPSNPPRETYGVLFNQMVSQREQAENSARTILKLLFQRYAAKSVLDVGCGIGTWLSAARGMGVSTIQGIDGPWLDRSKLVVEPECVSVADLEKPLDLGKRFDLAICLETAEHVAPAAADTLVASLVRHAPMVLFSAAIPYQRGPGHVNEQWPGYWAQKFSQHRYSALDFIRVSIWHDEQVLWWYRQNVLLYVDFEWCKSQPLLWREGEIQNLRKHPSAIVLPDLFFTIAKKLNLLEKALLDGGHYAMSVDDHGMIHLKKADAPSVDGDSPHVTLSFLRKPSL